jgi:hypothetical protein
MPFPQDLELKPFPPAVVADSPVVDVSTLDAPATYAHKALVEKRVAALRGDPSRVAEREALKRELLTLDAHIRELKEQQKRASIRRNFAGVGSPLHEAIVERFSPEIVAELEAKALVKQAEREQRAAERKAAKDK